MAVVYIYKQQEIETNVIYNMAFVKLTSLVLFVVFYTNLCVTAINENDLNRNKLIESALEHLNANPNKLYNYKAAKILNTQQKANIFEFTLETDVDCINNYPQIPCTETVLICAGFLQQLEKTYQILGDINCRPQIAISVERADEVPAAKKGTPVQTDSKIDLSHEAASSESGEPFVAMRKDSVPCLGCLYDLNTNAEGINNLVEAALKHVESERDEKHAVVKIVRLQQQVVAGIKSILLLEIAPTSCSKNEQNSIQSANKESIYCQVSFIDKPWLRQPNIKNIFANNCTKAQEFQYTFAAPISTPKPTDVSDAQLLDLESQIVVDVVTTPKPATEPIFTELESQIIVENKPTLQAPLDNSDATGDRNRYSVFNVIDTLFDSLNFIGFNDNEGVDVIDCDTSITSNNIRKRSVEFGKVPQSDRELVKQLANFAAASLDKIDADHNKRIILQTLGAKKLKHRDGYYYSLILRMGVSDCSEDSAERNCVERLKENLTKICKVQVEVDARLENPRVLKSQCSNIKQFKNRTINLRSKRAVLIGGFSDVTNHPYVKKLIAESLEKLNSESKLSNLFVHRRLISAKRQVVSGLLWKIDVEVALSDCAKSAGLVENCKELLTDPKRQICEYSIWEKPWLHFKNITVKCRDLTKKEEEANVAADNLNEKEDSSVDNTIKRRTKRDVELKIKGAPVNAIDDPKVKQLIADSLVKFNSESNHNNLFIHNRVVSATKQVVSGLRWKIKVEMALSDCTKPAPLHENCRELTNDAKKQICEFDIWEQAWLDRKDISSKCWENMAEADAAQARRRRSPQIPGGPVDASDDPKVTQLIADSLVKFNSESKHNNLFIHNRVVSASKQVVAGLLWKIKVEMALSDCTKPAPPHENCKELLGDSKKQICQFDIWEQAWLNRKDISSKCWASLEEANAASSRHKRSLDEDQYSIPTTIQGELKPNPVLLSYLKNGLEYMDQFSNHSTKYMLQKIVSVAKKNYLGTMWTLKVNVALSDCPKSDNSMRYCSELSNGASKKCKVLIWDQPMLQTDGPTVKFHCGNEPEYLLTARANPEAELFRSFVAQHRIQYATGMEYAKRLRIFKSNLKRIEQLNRFEQGTATYGITKFADLTAEEFSKSHGYRPDLRNANEVAFVEADIPDVELPAQFDWRTKNAVTEVKNQGQCGSCWAFSTTGNVEGQYAIKHGKLLEFSEQELVDCDTIDSGCNGGLMDNAYRIIEKIGGLEQEKDYPYDAEDEKCHFDKAKSVVQLSGALNISHDETDMAKWLTKNGPISIAINANAMQFYVGGVSHPWKMLCDPTNLDHGVLIVGYGVHKYALFNKTLPFWIVKNSWGPGWGEQGYYRVFRGDGTCGLNQTPSSGIVV